MGIVKKAHSVFFLKKVVLGSYHHLDTRPACMHLSNVCRTAQFMLLHHEPVEVTLTLSGRWQYVGISAADLSYKPVWKVPTGRSVISAIARQGTNPHTTTNKDKENNRLNTQPLTPFKYDHLFLATQNNKLSFRHFQHDATCLFIQIYK